MNDSTPLTLAARQLFVVPDAGAVRIDCTAGCLWLTLDHDGRDIILRPGDSFEAQAPRRAILYALEPSGLRLQLRDQGSMRRKLSKKSSDWSRSPSVWAATSAASSG
ncbi:MAG: hypothetical protein JWP41_4699 [Ramlibacter sp.]|jgi:hypothetical protein|nr:hypothetical protein [Ramlibacter sp.]